MPQKADQSSRKVLLDQQNPKKWAGKDPLTIRICNQLVYKLSEILNLDEVLTFDLLEAYFMTNDSTRKQLLYLRALDKEINDLQTYQGQGPNVQFQTSAILIQSKLHSLETCEKEFNRVVNEILNEAQLVYFQERICLLQCVLTILGAAQNAMSNGQPILKDTLVKEMCEKNKLAENLIKSLDQTDKNLPIFMNLNNQREIIINIQKEQILVLQCLLKIYKNFEVPTVQNILVYLNYELPNDFKGIKFPMHGYQSDTTIQSQQKKIVNLSVLQTFNIFQIHLFTVEDRSEQAKNFVKNLITSPDFQTLQKLVCDLEIDDVKSTIFLAFRQLLNVILKLDLLTLYGIPGKERIALNNFDLKNKRVQDCKFMDQIISMKDTNQQFEEEFYDRKGEMNLLIQDWINITYPYFKQNKMVIEIEQSQSLTFDILKQPIHLKYIWQQINNNKQNIMGKNLKAQNDKKVVYHSLDIFENILENPFNEMQKFATLMIALCGNKYHKYDLKVLQLLLEYKIGDIDNHLRGYHLETTLLQFIVGEFQRSTIKLGTQKLSSNDFATYSSICILIGKIIAHNFILYEEINSELISLRFDDMDERRYFRGQNIENYKENDPLLYTIIQSLNSIIYWDVINDVVYAFKYLLLALTSIYKHLNLQREILYHLSRDISGNQVPIFIEFFQWYLDNYEVKDHLYPITQTYLKFLDAVFQKPYPCQYIIDDKRLDIDNSILNEFLHSIYSPVLMNFTRLDFVDMKDFFKLYYRLLKLTNHLLIKFKDVNPFMKAPLSHRFPQFDQMLRLIVQYMNKQNIEFLIINAILLQEEVINGISTGLTNKFWVEQMRSGRSDESRQRIRIQKMIKTALSSFNTLMELSLFNQQMTLLGSDQVFQVGARGYYVSNLQCVQNITNFVKSPGQWEQYPLSGQSGVSYSVFNIVQYYIKPHIHLNPYMSIVQIEAVQFFVNCCKIWELQPLGQRVSLESVIRTAGLTHKDIIYKYIQNLSHCARKLDTPAVQQFLIAFFDLLIISSGSQQQFVEDLFKEEETQKAFNDILKFNFGACQRKEVDQNPVYSILAHEVEARIIILISEMSNQRVCDDFILKLVQTGELSNIYNNTIRRFLDEAQRVPVIEYNGKEGEDFLEQQQIKQFNRDTSINVFNKCSTLITIKYYLRLLQDEYQRNSKQDQVKKAIFELFSNQRIHSLGDIKLQSANEMFIDMLKINSIMKTYNQRNFDNISAYSNCVYGSAKLNGEQVDLMNNIANKYVTDDSCPVFLNNLDCTLFYQYVQKMNPYQFFQITSLDFNNFSKIGTQFMINVSEFVGMAKIYEYENPMEPPTGLLKEVTSISSKYNLLVSYMYSYNQYVQGFRDFILTIGKARMRENMRHKELILDDTAFNTALLNLVINDDIVTVVKDKGKLDSYFNKLTSLMIDISKPVAKKIGGAEQLVGMLGQESVQIPYESITFYFDTALSEIELDLITVLIGVINSIADRKCFTPDIIKGIQNDLIFNLIKGLPRIRQNQIEKNFARDQSQIIRAENEKIAQKLFINLVLQTFSLGAKVFENKDMQIQNQALLQQEIDLIQTLSQVMKIIQDGFCFSEGIKILEQGFSLIQNEHILYFMKKQDIPPLRIILQRFINPSTPIEESIKIIEFLTSYAGIEEGAKHLYLENVLKSISISQLITLVNQNEFYTMEVGDPKRNPIHILWCHFLLFLRTLNHNLFSDIDYRRLISQQITYFWPRINAVLQFGAYLKEPLFDQKMLSLALFEELELITGIISQYFDYCEEFARQDFQKYAEVKDKLLFGVLYFFSEEKMITYCSATEQYLNGITNDSIKDSSIKIGDRQSITGFDLIVHTQKIKIFQNLNASILNMLLINQEQAFGLLNTWDPIDYRQRMMGTSRASELDYQSQTNLSYMTANYQGYDSLRGLSLISMALENIISSLSQMTYLYKQYILQGDQLQVLQKQVFGLFKHDEWITNEYFGMNHYFAVGEFSNMLIQFESSLQMGYFDALLMLQSLKNIQEQRKDMLDPQITDKQLIDYGEDIQKLYLDFINESKSKGKLLSADINSQIKEYVDRLKADQRYIGY